MVDNQYVKVVCDILDTMGFRDVVNYVVFDNPVSRVVVKPFTRNGTNILPAPIIINERVPLWQLVSERGPFLRIAGLSGALAVGLGAYGSHKAYPKDKADELKAIYLTANKFHFIHTLALLGVPLCRKPAVTGSLMICGMLLFAGPCYYHAFTNDDKFKRFAPVGGTILLLAWLSMVL